MDKIPVTFTYKGEEYNAVLSEVSGATGETWYLMIGNYYNGTLIHSGQGWQFTSQTGKFQELTEYFAAIVIAWKQ